MAHAVSTDIEHSAAPGRRRVPPWLRAAAFAAACGAGVLALYLVHPLISAFELPIGPDGPVYVWWTRYAEAAGLHAVPGGRPGLPALALGLRAFLGTGVVETITLLGPVLAATAGLAASALLETALGPNLVRAAAGAVLTSSFAAYLAGGWLGNTALVALFLAAGAALALAGRSWRAVGGAAALLAAGALTHPIVTVFVLAVVAGVALAHVPQAFREQRSGVRTRDTLPARLLIAAGGGAAVTALGLLPALGSAPVPGDTSQDGFFRRHGFTGLLLDRYRERLRGDAARTLVPFATGLGLGVLWPRRGPATPGERYLFSLVVAWGLVTLIGLVVLAATGWAAPNRVLVFAFFLPLAAAAGLASAWRRGRILVALGAGLVAVGFVAASMFGWVRQSPAFTAAELGAAREAGRAVASLPPDTPLIFAVDTDQPAAAYHLTRALNVIRTGLPPDRIADSHLAVGSIDDVIGGRPRLNGDPEHDGVARAYASELPASGTEPLPYVVLVPGFGASPPASPGTSGDGFGYIEVPPAPPAPGRSPQALAALSIAALAVLAALGGGWGRWLLVEAGPRAAIAVAPAAGVAVIVITSVFGEALGFGARTWSITTATVVVGVIGYGLPLLRRTARRHG